MSHETFRIAILVDTATGWGRRTIRGILDYSLEHGPWDIWVRAKGQEESFGLPANEHFDGVIARIATKELQAELQRSQLPVVNISSIELANQVFPRVTMDIDISSDLAIGHFKHRALKNCAYIWAEHGDNDGKHIAAFEKAAARGGMSCHVFPCTESPSNTNLRDVSQQRLVAWLQHLPKPIGIYTRNSSVGRDAIAACRKAQLQVPHDVAILGADYDDLLSDASHPALSGILNPAQQVGYQAASILHQQMRGESICKDTTLIAPKTVVERLSTETLAINDPQTRQALEYLQAHACEHITVDDILKKVPLARRALERRFKRLLGRSPAKEICRIRIQRARKLLTETNLPMQDIAEACGYTSYTYLGNVFKKETGISPGRYRKQMQVCKDDLAKH